MSTPSVAQARADLAAADMLFDAQQVNDSIDKLATELTEQLGEKFPYVLAVMGGAVIFTGQLLPRLNFPLDFSYVHVSRYSDRRHGGELIWKQAPPEEIRGRDVLVLDDILDEGHTMLAIRDKVLAMGAASFRCAVFANKLIGKDKPIYADYVGLDLPNRFVFGFGMDLRGVWRNLPAVYAVK